MTPDFSAAYSSVFRRDGTMIPVTIQVFPIAYAADIDGLLMTAQAADDQGIGQFTPEKVDSLLVLPRKEPGDWCLLSVLFPMSFGAAEAKCRQGQFPIKHGDFVTVTRRIDEAVGTSGERYSRFEAYKGLPG